MYLQGQQIQADHYPGHPSKNKIKMHNIHIYILPINQQHLIKICDKAVDANKEYV